MRIRDTSGDSALFESVVLASEWKRSASPQIVCGLPSVFRVHDSVCEDGEQLPISVFAFSSTKSSCPQPRGIRLSKKNKNAPLRSRPPPSKRSATPLHRWPPESRIGGCGRGCRAPPARHQDRASIEVAGWSTSQPSMLRPDQPFGKSHVSQSESTRRRTRPSQGRSQQQSWTASRSQHSPHKKVAGVRLVSRKLQGSTRRPHYGPPRCRKIHHGPRAPSRPTSV